MYSNSYAKTAAKPAAVHHANAKPDAASKPTDKPVKPKAAAKPKGAGDAKPASKSTSG